VFERFARDARTAVSRAISEASRRGDRKVSTDHVLISVLHDPAIAQQIGAGPEEARQAADRLDRRALAAIGIDVDALGPLEAGPKATQLPFTPGTKAVLKRALTYTAAEKSRRIQTRHLLLALLEREPPDPAAELLAELRAETTRRDPAGPPQATTGP
jgi:ATP-dependent Clp protease ATP-binding subunit ClpA